MNRAKAKSSIHFQDDPPELCPYSVIIRDGESPACEFATFSHYHSAQHYARMNAATSEFDCGQQAEADGLIREVKTPPGV